MAADRNIGKYIEFLRFCLHEEAEIPECVSDMNWHALLAFARKQSIVGTCWEGVSRLSDIANKPTEDDILEWMSIVGTIRKRNRQTDKVAAWTTENFRKEGFETCLLKGQGAALLYPDPLLRMPGDVDVWVRPEGGQKEKEVIAYVRRFCPKSKACYHHIDFVSKENIPIEVHYRPQWMNSPIHNHRLQKFFAQEADRQFNHTAELPNGSGSISVPTVRFNIVFMLAHVYNHLLHEGIGFRQLIDYYYLLRNRPATDKETNWADLFRKLGLKSFARAVMWLMQSVFGLEEKYLLDKPDKRLGQLLLNEMTEGGNFGKYDERTLSGTYTSPMAKNVQRILRDIRLMWYFPSECLWEPWFRIYHWIWRKRNN
ncbi:nucleotidyltransferase family protein [Prevotella dentasini]|uniref:nucleotidyltransferase family protein n=1 Tax=Prevotella dentasini TaxID=589537 RepID=UPI000469F0A9|nr:nucleotidyltransferase family protein [Prevotella dentasini]